jgi:tRNA(Ile)-lysidine synthase
MELAENLANKLNVKFHLIKKTKPESSVNTQLWARSLRYEFFNDLCFEFGYEKIATAHHSNDSLETMLINLSRGTGINGLSGIPKQRGNIVRPFLETTRQDIEAYVEEHNLEYREDMSNHQSDYLRNIFRNQVLPILEDYDGDILKKLTASNKNLKDDSHALNELCQAFVATHFNGQTINLTEIPESVRATVLYHILRP